MCLVGCVCLWEGVMGYVGRNVEVFVCVWEVVRVCVGLCLYVCVFVCV